MPTTLFTHPACRNHSDGPDHPECPQRLDAILQALSTPDFAALERRTAPAATRAQIARVHAPAYIDKILAPVDKGERRELDADTALSTGSAEAALHAAGAVIAALDHVLDPSPPASPTPRNAFCAVRPPGHHAHAAASSGFCLFNNIAIGAAHARAAHSLNRIAIADFDVHHGDGTQSWAENHPEILFISSHQFPLWPGSGRAEERGPHGNILNVPLPPGTDGQAFRAAWSQQALPALDRFAPELLLVSAGFDAHRDDPLASLALLEDDYVWITQELLKVAATHSQGRLVSVLEGGYALGALATCAAAHIRELMTYLTKY